MSRDTCRCYPGFQGENCSVVADCEYLGNCSGHGSCVQENPGGNLTCRCADQNYFSHNAVGTLQRCGKTCANISLRQSTLKKKGIVALKARTT